MAFALISFYYVSSSKHFLLASINVSILYVFSTFEDEEFEKGLNQKRKNLQIPACRALLFIAIEFGVFTVKIPCSSYLIEMCVIGSPKLGSMRGPSACE